MSSPLPAGTKLGRYLIRSLIGTGGMGEVYRAHDSRLDRDVAIKLLLADVSSDTDRLMRFEQEARTTSALNHPNILTVFDVGTHEGGPYIVAELLSGEELRELYYRKSNLLMSVPVETGAAFHAGTPKELFKGVYDLRSNSGVTFDVDPKTNRFLMIRLGDGVISPTQIRVVVNWFEELRRAVSGN